MQSRKTDNDWPLRFVKKKAELAGPQQQHSQHYALQDIDAFAIRRDPASIGLNFSEDAYQVISTSSDQNLKVMTMNKSFVKEFSERDLFCLTTATHVEE